MSFRTHSVWGRISPLIGTPRLLVCGDREWTDRDLIREVLDLCQPSLVIHGDCRGADKLADAAAKELGIPTLPFPANWREYHRAAGPIRNQQMLNEGQPTAVLAFHSNIDTSKGTKNMLHLTERAKLPICLVVGRVP